MDPRQPSLGWPDVRLHASNRVLITVVTQGVVGLEKSRAAAGRERQRRAGRVAAAVGRMRALWICVARSRIRKMHVTVLNETIGVSLTALCSNWIHGHYSKYRLEILSSPRMVDLQTLMSGPVSWAMMVSEPISTLLGVGSVVIFLFWLLTLTRGPATISFELKCASLKY
jgi:hypothetical protein